MGLDTALPLSGWLLNDEDILPVPCCGVARNRNGSPHQECPPRRVSEGHSKRDSIRCLKRFVARELYNDIQAITHANTTRPPLEIVA